jgi:hypothetical protein
MGSACVPIGGEPRCIALLEDRIRISTGGRDGSLSVIDLQISRNYSFGDANAGSGGRARCARRYGDLPGHEITARARIGFWLPEQRHNDLIFPHAVAVAF